MISSTQVAPDRHPLFVIDQFLLESGWINNGEGWLPPESWRDVMRVYHGGSAYSPWKREHAIVFTVRYWERCDSRKAGEKP